MEIRIHVGSCIYGHTTNDMLKSSFLYAVRAMKTDITLCMGCGEDRVLSPEHLCIPCYEDAKRILAENNYLHEKYSKMSDEERWEKAKAAL